MEILNYFWGIVFDSIIKALALLILLAIMVTAFYMMQEWFKARKEVLKYRKGYNNAIKDAIDDVNALYDEWNADDPLADVPSQKIIVLRLENLKYVNKRNIPTE